MMRIPVLSALYTEPVPIIEVTEPPPVELFIMDDWFLRFQGAMPDHELFHRARRRFELTRDGYYGRLHYAEVI